MLQVNTSHSWTIGTPGTCYSTVQTLAGRKRFAARRFSRPEKTHKRFSLVGLTISHHCQVLLGPRTEVAVVPLGSLMLHTYLHYNGPAYVPQKCPFSWGIWTSI